MSRRRRFFRLTQWCVLGLFALALMAAGIGMTVPDILWELGGQTFVPTWLFTGGYWLLRPLSDFAFASWTWPMLGGSGAVLGGVFFIRMLFHRNRQSVRIVTTLIVVGGLAFAALDYRLAFDESLNQFHAMRGLVWNIGTYTAARALWWWAKG